MYDKKQTKHVKFPFSEIFPTPQWTHCCRYLRRLWSQSGTRHPRQFSLHFILFYSICLNKIIITTEEGWTPAHGHGHLTSTFGALIPLGHWTVISKSILLIISSEMSPLHNGYYFSFLQHVSKSLIYYISKLLLYYYIQYVFFFHCYLVFIQLCKHYLISDQMQYSEGYRVT